MAYTARNLNEEMVHALVAAHNSYQISMVAAEYHASVTQDTSADYRNPTVVTATVTAADATDLATSLVLCNDCNTQINKHFADDMAHDSAGSAATATASATTLATAITRANALKAAFNTHLAEASVHYSNDVTNAIAAADATDQGSLNTLLNEMKDDNNAHIISAPTGAAMVKVVAA